MNLPTSIHDVIVLGAGELWLCTPDGSVTPGSEKYKLFSSDPTIWKALCGMNGVKASAVYFRYRTGGVCARDFIVERFAVETVINRLRSLTGDK